MISRKATAKTQRLVTIVLSSDEAVRMVEQLSGTPKTIRHFINALFKRDKKNIICKVNKNFTIFYSHGSFTSMLKISHLFNFPCKLHYCHDRKT